MPIKTVISRLNRPNYDSMTLTFYFHDFPAEHWLHIRTSNPIEFAMVFKLVQGAEKRWKRLYGFALMADIIEGVEFKSGIKQVERTDAGAV